MNELISVADAEQRIRRAMPVFGSERVALDAAAGRVLRQFVHAERDQPPFDRVMMDGIAIAMDSGGTRRFRLRGLQLAGMLQQTLGEPDACMEVTTGAILPRGCDTVVPVEQTSRDGEFYLLADSCTPSVRQFVHPQGSDCRKSDVLLQPGMRLRGPEMAVLASNGVAEVDVAAMPSVTIIATGDELVGVDQPLRQGQIRGSNDRALAAALHTRGFADVQLARVADDLASTIATLDELLQTRQVLVLSGGVSVGQRDYVPDALRALGVRQVLHRIAQRPGKPMWFGIGRQGQVVFALPGNPVSALVCATRYLLPALQSAIGLVADTATKVCLERTLDTSTALTLFVPVRVHHDASGRAMATPLPPGTSGDFSSLPRTHGFVELPSGSPAPAGTVATFYSW
jgi:molybdopterin molybdotransferase